jgi:hypothetical protein
VDPKQQIVDECNKQHDVAAKWNEVMACADRIAAKGTCGFAAVVYSLASRVASRVNCLTAPPQQQTAEQ